VNGRLFTLAVVLVLAAGCSQLKQGRCNSSSDCKDPAAPYCDTYNKICTVSDAGVHPDASVHHDAGTDAHDAAVDKAPPSCLDGKHPCTDKAKPFCDDKTGMCRGCKQDNECLGLDGGVPVCNTPDGGAGMCVQCLVSADCQDPNASACVSNRCDPCKADSDCAKFPPSVCKQPVATGDAAPTPRRCASDAEVIYVNRTAGSNCSDTPAAADAGPVDAGAKGSMAVPFCSLQPALNAISKTRNVIVITGSVPAGTWTYADQAKGPLLIVGQNKATVLGTGSPSFSMSSGNVTIRNVDFQSSLSNGIEASGGMITLDHVTVEKCVGGGILLDGGSFDIENSTIKGNGIAMDGAIVWSGIYVKTTPSAVSSLNLVTIHDNDNTGLQCAGKITGTGVLAFNNHGGVDIGGLCGVTNCGSSDASASTMCGTQM
jgi:hypothetical protein